MARRKGEIIARMNEPDLPSAVGWHLRRVPTVLRNRALIATSSAVTMFMVGVLSYLLVF